MRLPRRGDSTQAGHINKQGNPHNNIKMTVLNKKGNPGGGVEQGLGLGGYYPLTSGAQGGGARAPVRKRRWMACRRASMREALAKRPAHRGAGKRVGGLVEHTGEKIGFGE